MRILVTGASGFIGLRLVSALLEQGNQISVLCRNTEKAQKLLPKQCTIIKGDITDKDSLLGCCENIDMVYQLVGLSGNELPSEYQLKRFRKINVEGLKNIIEEAKRAKVKRFIQVSSIAAMGIVKKMPINSESVCEPYLPYQVTKREGELLALNEFKKNGFPVIIVRPAKVYGIGGEDTYKSIINMCRKRIFPKIGIKDTMVSHCYIDDLITNLSLLTNKGELGKIYIFATEKSIGFYESVRMISKEMNIKVLMIPMPRWFVASIAYCIERFYVFLGKKAPVTRRNVLAATTDRIYDFSINKKDLGFVSSISMEEGIKRIMEYHRQTGFI